ncbi:hypothetical protein [Pseudomonas sp. BBP2017]|uniref:hypothetical protein n=1 Tax=Pseudomonas sp. BBP2017 TaxID=2109731 RepID=UPI0011B1CD87|nr:hypothetical protein [Pseudomonas sp. BBP2017]
MPNSLRTFPPGNIANGLCAKAAVASKHRSDRGSNQLDVSVGNINDEGQRHGGLTCQWMKPRNRPLKIVPRPTTESTMREIDNARALVVPQGSPKIF